MKDIDTNLLYYLLLLTFFINSHNILWKLSNLVLAIVTMNKSTSKYRIISQKINNTCLH